MDFEEIIEKIKLGLTGDIEKDVIYIMHKNAEYKKSPFSDRINRETGKMIYDMLSDEEKVLFGQVLTGDSFEIMTKIKNAEKEVFEGAYMNAIKILESIIPNICNEGKSDGTFDYVSLNNLFEMCIYSEIYKKGILVKPTPFNFAYVFKIYGYSLFKLSKDDEAENAYNNAIFWNPIGVDILLDLAELKYMKKQYRSFIGLIKKCFKYCYDINQIALCYFNLGRYYYQKQNYEIAADMYILSHYFKPNKAAYQKLESLSSEKKIDITPPSPVDMKKICESLDIQMGVNPDIIRLAASSGTNAKQQGNIEAAKYFYDILFSLTGDKAIMDTVFDYMKDIKNKSTETDSKSFFRTLKR